MLQNHWRRANILCRLMKLKFEYFVEIYAAMGTVKFDDFIFLIILSLN